MSRKTSLQLLLLGVLVLVAGVLLRFGNDIFDHIHLTTYDPPKEITQLATDAGMNDRGRRYFYRFSPLITDTATLRDRCGQAYHPVGCVTGNQIYILEPDQPIDKYENIVTASHEMLHVAYSRLSRSERKELATSFADIFNRLEPDVVADIKQYQDQEEYVLQDETHAIIGSQSDKLSNKLRDHYRQYFSDRQKTVSAYQISN
jgi:hypothetical protein